MFRTVSQQTELIFQAGFKDFAAFWVWMVVLMTCRTQFQKCCWHKCGIL